MPETSSLSQPLVASPLPMTVTSTSTNTHSTVLIISQQFPEPSMCLPIFLPQS